jgi:hypothetical protein
MYFSSTYTAYKACTPNQVSEYMLQLRSGKVCMNLTCSMDADAQLVLNGPHQIKVISTDRPLLALQGKCTFAARLSDQQIEDLSAYVLQQASNGWK